MAHPQGKWFGETLSEAVRDRFCHVQSDPISGPRIYLESAGGGLTLKTVVDVVAQQTALPDNAGRDNPTSQAIDRIIAQGKTDAMALIGARSGVVALGESTTANAFKALAALIARVPGDNVVTTNLDHPAVFDATRQLTESHGKQWRVAGLSPDLGAVEPESILCHIDPGTIVLALIHSSNITGLKHDVGAIIRRAREINPDLFVLVDGAQHVPHGPVDVDALGCDAYLASSYKAFSKIGASLLYLSDRAAQLPHPKLLGKPQQYWELGTREQAGYAGWSAVVDYLCWLGGHFGSAGDRRDQVVAAMQAIELHERALTHRLLRGSDQGPGLLDMDDVSVYGQTDNLTLREPTVIFNVHGRKPAEVVSHLRHNGIRVHQRVSDGYSAHTLTPMGIQGCVRVSLAHYNTASEVDSFLQALHQGVQ